MQGFIGRCWVEHLAHGLDAHVAVLQLPLVVGFEQHSADEADDSSLHDVAKFWWRVLLDRASLKARYGEGFRAGTLEGLDAGTSRRSGERAHGALLSPWSPPRTSVAWGEEERTADRDSGVDLGGVKDAGMGLRSFVEGVEG